MVEVEADLSKQTPEFHLIGLPDKALGEAVRRVHNACANSELPLAAAQAHREPVARQPAEAGLRLRRRDRDRVARHGGRDGCRLRRAHACTSASSGSTDGCGPCPACCRRCTRPRARDSAGSSCRTRNRARGRAGRGHDGARCGVPRAMSRGGTAPRSSRPSVDPVAGPRVDTSEPEPPDLVDVVGQREAVEALIAAAAGGHHMLMTGPPGAGKTMLASRLPGILPALDDDAALEVASIRSLSGDPVAGARHGARRSRRRITAPASPPSSAAGRGSSGRAPSRGRATGCSSSTRPRSSPPTRSTPCGSRSSPARSRSTAPG